MTVCVRNSHSILMAALSCALGIVRYVRRKRPCRPTQSTRQKRACKGSTTRRQSHLWIRQAEPTIWHRLAQVQLWFALVCCALHLKVSPHESLTGQCDGGVDVTGGSELHVRPALLLAICLHWPAHRRLQDAGRRTDTRRHHLLPFAHECAGRNVHYKTEAGQRGTTLCGAFSSPVWTCGMCSTVSCLVTVSTVSVREPRACQHFVSGGTADQNTAVRQAYHGAGLGEESFQVLFFRRVGKVPNKDTAL